MINKELTNFTNEELKLFTNINLTRDKYELIAKAENQSLILPEDIQKKLRSLCRELIQQSPNQKHFFENLTFHKVNDALTLIINLSKVYNILSNPNLCVLLRNSINAICVFLSKH